MSVGAKVIAFLTNTNVNLRDVRALATPTVVSGLRSPGEVDVNDPNILRGWADGLDSLTAGSPAIPRALRGVFVPVVAVAETGEQLAQE